MFLSPYIYLRRFLFLIFSAHFETDRYKQHHNEAQHTGKPYAVFFCRICHHRLYLSSKCMCATVYSSWFSMLILTVLRVFPHISRAAHIFSISLLLSACAVVLEALQTALAFFFNSLLRCCNSRSCSSCRSILYFKNSAESNRKKQNRNPLCGGFLFFRTYIAKFGSFLGIIAAQ